MNDDTALRIYQAHLNEVDAAVAARDFALFQRFFRFPHQIETMTDSVFVSTPEHLRDIFDTLCAQLDKQAIPSVDRIATSASFSDARTIKGFHQSRLVRQDAIVTGSYSSLSTLERERDADGTGAQDCWRLTRSQFFEGADAMPSLVIARYLRRYPETGRPTAQSRVQSNPV